MTVKKIYKNQFNYNKKKIYLKYKVYGHLSFKLTAM